MPFKITADNMIFHMNHLHGRQLTNVKPYNSKQCRPWSDAAFSSIWSGSVLFAWACLPQYLWVNMADIIGAQFVKKYAATGKLQRSRQACFLLLLWLAFKEIIFYLCQHTESHMQTKNAQSYLRVSACQALNFSHNSWLLPSFNCNVLQCTT